MQSPETEAKLTGIRAMENKTLRLDYWKQEASLLSFIYTLPSYMKELMWLPKNTYERKY